MSTDACVRWPSGILAERCVRLVYMVLIFSFLPGAGAAAHDLVRFLGDQLTARLAPLGIILSLCLVIAHVHKFRVVVAICFTGRAKEARQVQLEFRSQSPQV